MNLIDDYFYGGLQQVFPRFFSDRFLVTCLRHKPGYLDAKSQSVYRD